MVSSLNAHMRTTSQGLGDRSDPRACPHWARIRKWSAGARLSSAVASGAAAARRRMVTASTLPSAMSAAQIHSVVFMRKLAELDDQIAKAHNAREAIEHALVCPHDDILQCP